MISFVSAWDWDNIKEYIPEEDRIDIYNSWIIPNVIKGTKLAEVKLIENTDYCIKNCEAILEVKLLTDYENIIPSFETYEVNDKTKEKKINAYRIFLRDNGTIRMVDDYEMVCDTREVWNGTESYNCSQVEVGNHPELEYKYEKYEGEYLIAGTYIFKIRGTKDREESVDWIASIMGVETTEWAVWLAGFNEGLFSYFNGTSLLSANGDPAFTVDVSAGDPQLTDWGKVGGSWAFDGDDEHSEVTEHDSYDWTDGNQNFTINYWVYWNSTTGSQGTASTESGWRLNKHSATHQITGIGFCTGDGNIVGTQVFSAGTWYMYTMINNATHLGVYTNGVLEITCARNDWTGGDALEVKFGDDGSSFFIGHLDEIGFWNRSLSQAELDDIYNGGTGLTYVGTFTNSPTVNLMTPINDTNSSVTVDDFVFNITFGSTDWVNYTFNVWNSSSDVIKDRFVVNGTPDADCSETNHFGDAVEIECVGQGITDGDYLWNVYGCNDDDLCDWDNNFTLTIDGIPPTINSVNNLTNQVVFSLPINSTWNYSVSDPHLETCWYNTTDNATIGYVTCNSTILTNWETQGSKKVYYWVNDSFGNENSGSTPLNITFISIDYTHTPDAVGELGSVFFDLYVNKTDIETTTAYLWFNNTLYNPDNTDAYTDYTYFNYTFSVPNEWGNSTGWNYNYYWNYTISGVVDNRSTTLNNFTVYSMEMDNCSVFDVEILRFNLYDEEDNVVVNGSAGSNIEVDVIISLGSAEWLYSETTVNNETAKVCVPEGVINNTNYTIDYTVGFDSTDRVWEFFYVDGGLLDNNNDSLNSLTNKTVTLYDLQSADSTSFLFNYFDEDGLPVEDSIVHVLRKYIGEGVFREVERARQDENGDTTIHLVEEDVIYYFIITSNGDTLYTSSTYTALCQAVPCTIQIEASGDLVEFDDDWDLIINGSYSLTQSSSTRIVNLTYTFIPSATANLTLYRYDSDGDYVYIIGGEDTGTSGTISLTVPSSVGNKTFFATIYKDGEFINSEWISMEEDAGIYFGNSLALFLAFLVILCLGLMAISEGGAVIIWVIIGMIITSALGLIDFATSTGVSLLIYFICAGAIIIWKLTRGRK
jgi:hypothetical protein